MMPTPQPRLDDLKRQIAQLDALIAEGVLTGSAARARRDALELQIVGAVTAGGNVLPTDAAPRPSRALVSGLAVFVLAFGMLGYTWRGNLDGLSVAPGQAARGPAAAADTPANQAEVDAQVLAMVDKLAARLKDKPDDVEGLSMLARSYTALRRFADALPVYKRLLDLRPRDAQAMVDYADALAMANNRSLDGEPEALVLRAVKLDPANLKALSLAGTVAFNRGEYADAVAYWQKAVDISEPGGELGRQLQGAMADARQRGGLPAAGAASKTDAPGNAASAAQRPMAAASSISGRIVLAAALQGKVAPGDTLFVFARPVGGSKMPLAILRKQAGDLPLDFTLDDSLAMSPAARLSSAQQVVVGARISKSGNAMPQAGDLQAFSGPVAVGSGGMRLEIGGAVR